MRIIARREKEVKSRIKGALYFDSGWEWSYWFNDVIAAYSSWNPHLEIQDENLALYHVIESLFGRYFGSDSSSVTSLLVEFIQVERQLLTWGILPNTTMETSELNGIAYLAGWDTWSDLGCDFTSRGCVQPISIQNISYPFTI